MSKEDISYKIKEYAFSLGFDACTICKAEPVNEVSSSLFKNWIRNNYQADMGYMARNEDKRLDPTLLVEGAKSMIILALNYYPQQFQTEEKPQIAYYAYGKDYHDIVKKKLGELYTYIQSQNDSIEGRYFCDTAPLLERYWAAKSGMGWIGKNSMLIIPRKGSYFFLSTIILNTKLEYEDELENKSLPNCGSCTRCIDACPTQAIIQPHVVDANKCLSYQTIENKGKIASPIIPNMSNRFYGCDICQQVCPWNKFSLPHSTQEFNPSEELLSLDSKSMENMEVEDYQRIFKGSPMKRAKLGGLKRNIEAWKRSEK